MQQKYEHREPHLWDSPRIYRPKFKNTPDKWREYRFGNSSKKRYCRRGRGN